VEGEDVFLLVFSKLKGREDDGTAMVSLVLIYQWKMRKISNELALLALQTARISSVMARCAAAANTTHLHGKNLNYWL
jgi:hypothetical protein